jgi:DNA polymerase
MRRVGSRGFAPTTGKGHTGVLIVAEALGTQEADAGKPLVGPTGQLTDRMVSRVEDPLTGVLLNRDDFYYSNVLWCKPPNNKLEKEWYENEAITHCSPHLEETLNTLKPKAILALGNVALRWFTGHYGVTKLRGYTFETKWGPVIPTYHPSFIMKGKFNLARVWQMDLKKALYIARHGVVKKPRFYITHPSPPEVLRFVERYESDTSRMLAFDIETPHSSFGKDEEAGDKERDKVLEDDPSYKYIIRISFAFEEGEAISFPWCPPYIAYAQRLLASPGPKCVWNKNFDVPRLRANGCPVSGRLYDGMEAWHYLEPGFPMGLKYAATFFCPDMPPWALETKTNPEWYSAADSDVLLRCLNGTRRNLIAQGRWDLFERQVVELGMVLQKISDRGVRTDGEKRRKAREELQGEYQAIMDELQTLVPREVKPCKVLKSTEESLKKRGSWVEGRMYQVKVLDKPPKPRKKKKAGLKGTGGEEANPSSTPSSVPSVKKE